MGIKHKNESFIKASKSVVPSIQHYWIYRTKYLAGLLQLAVGLLILFASAQATIPIGVVPVSCQTMGVLVVGLLYPVQIATLISFLYVLFGTFGMSIFAGYSCGLSSLLGPRGGYLVGFIMGTYAMVYLRKKFSEHTWWSLLFYGLIGIVIVYICGISWLSYLTSFHYALKVGFLPFLLIEPLKIIPIALIIYQVKKVLTVDKPDSSI